MCCRGFAAPDSDSNCRIGRGPQHNQRHGEGESLRRKRQDKPNPLLRHLKPHDITQNSPYAISGLVAPADPDVRTLSHPVSTRKIPMKRFSPVIYIPFLFPKLCWHNRSNRSTLATQTFVTQDGPEHATTAIVAARFVDWCMSESPLPSHGSVAIPRRIFASNR